MGSEIKQNAYLNRYLSMTQLDLEYYELPHKLIPITHPNDYDSNTNDEYE